MPKSDTIVEITRLNPTANPAFLVGFSNEELGKYLRRLSSVAGSQHRFDDRHDPIDPSPTPKIGTSAADTCRVSAS